MASENDSEIVRCNKCWAVLNESPSLPRSQRMPCPVCSSLSRDNLRKVNPLLNNMESRNYIEILTNTMMYIEP